MDPNEILHVAPELRNIVALIVGGVPVAEIVKAILVPPAQVIGKRMADRVDRLFEKTGKMVLESGVSPQPVEDKLLVEIVRGASVEDNEDLHTMWAALLANAASPEHAERVRPGFVAILNQMAPDEARLLNWTHDHSQGWTQQLGGLKWVEAQAELGFTSKKEADTNPRINSRMAACLDSLEAANLIRRNYYLPSTHDLNVGAEKFGYRDVAFRITITERGDTFIAACRPPYPKT